MCPTFGEGGYPHLDLGIALFYDKESATSPLMSNQLEHDTDDLATELDPAPVNKEDDEFTRSSEAAKLFYQMIFGEPYSES
jgi:hypothetical protein